MKISTYCRSTVSCRNSIITRSSDGPSDTRNTKVVDIYHTLNEYTNNITVYDPWPDAETVKKIYGIHVEKSLPDDKFDAIILCVAHNVFAALNVRSLLKEPKKGVVYDVKGFFSKDVVDGRL